MVTMRWRQIGWWVALTPVLALVQGVTTFWLPALRDAHGVPVFAAVALVYGMSWFTPTLLLCDLVIFRRRLSHRERVRHARALLATTALIGVVTPGFLAMVGYPASSVVFVAISMSRRNTTTG
jgi:hypothetical protein